jgi:signal transduction histidine kinase
MSHDIRTPMNAIIGFTHIAQKNINNIEKVKDCLVKVEHAGEHLLRLINDILGMANIENGNVEIKPEPCNIISAVKETEDIIKRDMYKKDIDFSVIFENITNENVICDVTRIRQIEINLLSNALKYTNRGGKVTYRVIQTGCNNGYASFELRIKDNGIGIDKDFQKHIFGAFERERSATESGVAGT